MSDELDTRIGFYRTQGFSYDECCRRAKRYLYNHRRNAEQYKIRAVVSQMEVDEPEKYAKLLYMVEHATEIEAESREKAKRYAEEQKEYAINKAQEIGVRDTARLLQLSRKTIQRWLRAKGTRVKRCPDWVYNWTYWRRKRWEKWERIKLYRQ